MIIRAYNEADVPAMREIWNEVVRADNAFPQEQELKEEEAPAFFKQQILTEVAVDGEKVVGLSILHPNGIGHLCGNANASYAVASSCRGKHIGEALVRSSLKNAKAKGFHLLQFNAVVASNLSAIHLYHKLGFQQLGVLKEGYRHNDGSYEDLVLFYHLLDTI